MGDGEKRQDRAGKHRISQIFGLPTSQYLCSLENRGVCLESSGKPVQPVGEGDVVEVQATEDRGTGLRPNPNEEVVFKEGGYDGSRVNINLLDPHNLLF